MNRIFYIVLFLIILLQTGYSQEKRFSVPIDWDEPRDISAIVPGHEPGWILQFEGAVNHDQKGLLPLYHHQFRLESQFYDAVIRLEEVVSEVLEVPDIGIPLTDRELIPGNFVLFQELVINRKEPYVSIYLLPLRVNPESGELERILSCEVVVEISYTEPLASPRQAFYEPAIESVLKDGDWYKISAGRTGIHRISYEDLESYGIDADGIDPRNIRLHGNGGNMLNESTSQPRPDDLVENAILVSGEEDGSFDPEDYILFYVLGPVKWTYYPFFQKFEHERNIYTDKAFYFLTVGDYPGKRISPEPAVPGQADIILTKTDDFTFHELDSLNLIKSGQEWYGEVYYDQVSYDYSFSFPDLDLGSPVYFKSNVVARSTETSNFSFYYEDILLGEQEIGSIQVSSAVYARTMTTRIFEVMPRGAALNFTVTYDKPNANSVGWMNYIQVNATSHLRFNSGQRGFRNAASAGTGDILQFEVSTAVSQVRIWDVTHHSEPLAMTTFPVAGGVGIRVAADTLREFLAFDLADLYTPQFEGIVENQDLHGMAPANMVMVVHPPFMEEAVRLADFHRQYSQLSVNLVTPEQVYNEFSSGAQDASAIRDFLKMLYDRSDGENELRYLLMFGDASYDYKGRLPGDDNLVPTFQSKESLKKASSFVTDDFFGCLDYGEGSNATGTVDLGIGRFPVRTLEEARTVVDKIIHYSTASHRVSGPWRNQICLVADDEDGNVHLKQAEELADIIDTTASGFNVSKIFLDAYEQQSSPLGNRYPDVSKAIDHTVSQGALIINYTGHGGEIGWADERVLDMPMILGWENYDRLPAFVTATCEFSRFDDPGLVSGGEWVLLNSRGGGIGLFTTTRLAYSTSNSALNKRFYEAAFVRDSLSGEYPAMGDLMRASKTPSSPNIKNFVLLGDPAMKLAYPFLNATTLTIRNENTGLDTDTLKALSHITISGQIENVHGVALSDFNGKVYPTIYDKPVLYQTRGNDDASKITDFYIQNKVLFKGEVTVSNGHFSFTFIVPRDISYPFGLGKISYYAMDTVTFQDAQGFTPVYVGGADETPQYDDQGPLIQVYLNDTTFRDGDNTTSSPVLIARLYDESGINAVGNGIGHDITAVLDGYTQNPFILNDYFRIDPDTYQSGWVEFPLGTLGAGIHHLTLKAWDIYNNSSEATIAFVIDTLSPIFIQRIINYPNPFREGTTFSFEHNKPGSDLDISIDIFSLDGRYIRSLEYEFTSENLESAPMYWDGRDSSGNLLGSGLYIFRLTASTGAGKYARASQKLIIIR